MLLKFIVILMLAAILWSLGSALLHMFRGGEGSHEKMVKALTWRIGLSLVLFALLMLGYATGILQPHGIAG